MSPLTDAEKKELIRRVTAGESLPETWRKRLFPDSGRDFAEPRNGCLLYCFTPCLPKR